MSVRGVGRGGKSGGAGRATGAQGPAKSGFGAKVDKSGGLVGPSGAVGSSNVGAAGAAAASSPVVAQAIELARQIKSGQIKSRDEASKKLVQEILRDKVRNQSKKLADKIFAHLKDDPRLAQTLERLWTKAEREE